MTDFSRISTVTSFSPAPVTLDAIRRIVREEVRAALADNAALRQASEQALEALNGTEALLVSMGVTHPLIYGEVENAITALRAVLKEKA